MTSATATTPVSDQRLRDLRALLFDLDGTLIDTKTSEFYSIPALGWPLSVLAALLGAAWLWRRRERSAGAGPAVRA